MNFNKKENRNNTTSFNESDKTLHFQRVLHAPIKVLSINETYHLVNNHVGSFNYDDFRLEEVVVIGYGSNSRARTGSSLSFQKIKISKTVLVKYNIN